MTWAETRSLLRNNLLTTCNNLSSNENSSQYNNLIH